MEIRGKIICGFQAIAVRDALRAFNDLETQFEFADGVMKLIPKRLTDNFLAVAMQIEKHEALALLQALISQGYVKPDSQTPTPLGMALIAAEDRDRLPWDQAQTVLEKFLEAVRSANARPDARVFIDEIRVFGSYFERKQTVGDIDLQIIAPLPEECMPEDFDEKDALFANLKTSEYLSFHDEFDLVATDAHGKTLYARSKDFGSGGET